MAEASSVDASALAVLFAYDFPELWHSWRHQRVYVAARGYGCVATHLRGYGGTTARLRAFHSPVESNSPAKLVIYRHVLSFLRVQVFVVGHNYIIRTALKNP